MRLAGRSKPATGAVETLPRKLARPQVKTLKMDLSFVSSISSQGTN